MQFDNYLFADKSGCPLIDYIGVIKLVKHFRLDHPSPTEAVPSTSAVVVQA